MPGSEPTDAALRAADRIVLVDPRHPGWYQPLFVRLVLRTSATVEIPVDSANPAAIQDWQQRIQSMNLDD